ncbi:helix-turn-helix domain-containing protein [Methylobacterium sp. Leaf108]|uniref:helix-turn-helix domain-containing protein n=1 Tax=Methylobacterium sp. Leaf108 TaxID=1736256 RepID=UPI0009E6EA08|nr:helix-turn-helix domain-containing protein [Methylobacterium sp. Leaf108]
MAQVVLLTLKEVATRLRCSVTKVQRLCFSGALSFIPGRPVLILEDDLNAYITGAAVQGSSGKPKIPEDKKSDHQKARDQLNITLEAIYKRSGNRLRMTPEIIALLEPFKDDPDFADGRRRAIVARAVQEQRHYARKNKNKFKKPPFPSRD